MRLDRSLPHHSQRVMIYLSQTEHHGRAADYVEIVARARKAGMAGATVVQGMEGFGYTSTVHRRRAVSLAGKLPVIVTMIDAPERIDAFLADIAELVSTATIVRQGVEVVLPRSGTKRT